jgi:hypothetical protein
MLVCEDDVEMTKGKEVPALAPPATSRRDLDDRRAAQLTALNQEKEEIMQVPVCTGKMESMLWCGGGSDSGGRKRVASELAESCQPLVLHDATAQPSTMHPSCIPGTFPMNIIE